MDSHARIGNLVITSLARFEFQVSRTIARINNPKNAWMFTADMGVDVALNQADLRAHVIAEEISLGDMMILPKLRNGQYSLVEEKGAPESRAAGKAVRDSGLPEKHVLAVVIRKGELMIPDSDTVLPVADEVLVYPDEWIFFAFRDGDRFGAKSAAATTCYGRQ